MLLGVYPGDLSARVLGPGRVAQGLGHGEIGVVQPHVLAHQADAHVCVRGLCILSTISRHSDKSGSGVVETEAPAD